MIEEMILWFIFGFFSLGALGINFILMRKAASKPWRLRISENYTPKTSILVPTYNESSVIAFKLQNLRKLEYPKELAQIIIVDSKSSDNTVDIVNNFLKMHSEMNVKVIVEEERKGKSSALNSALKHCDGEVIIVSDADCFWPSDILHKTLPFLSDPSVGAISGPKILLNTEYSWVTKDESTYLDSMNLVKLGESKNGSTLLFEGGFSAYKKEVLDSFDPYNTGSDDCGTVISLIEKQTRAIFVPEGRFYTVFPSRWAEKLRMKIRRANQLVRLFWKYPVLRFNHRIEDNNRTIIANTLIYLFGPIFFVLFLAVTAIVFVRYPYLIATLAVFLIPKVRNILIEAFRGFLVLFCGILGVAFRRNFLVWQTPADRSLLEEDMLRRRDLI